MIEFRTAVLQNIFEPLFLCKSFLVIAFLMTLSSYNSIFQKFSLFSGLSPNTAKCEIAVTLKGVNMEICGTKCLNLAKETENTWCTFLLQVNFQTHIIKIENILRLWHMRNFTIEGKILVFKSLAISKIVHLSLITTVLCRIIYQLKNIQKNIMWNRKNPDIQHFQTAMKAVV